MHAQNFTERKNHFIDVIEENGFSSRLLQENHIAEIDDEAFYGLEQLKVL